MNNQAVAWHQFVTMEGDNAEQTQVDTIPLLENPMAHISFSAHSVTAAGEPGTSKEALNKKTKVLTREDLEPPPPKIQLSAKQQEDIKDAFNAFDTDGTGHMQTRQLKVAMRALGFEPKKNEIKKLVTHVDKNNTGLLCFNDFVEIISTKLAEKDSKDEIMKAFRLFDRNSQGKITFENLQQIAAELGEGLNDEEVQEMITEADLDGDGVVNQDEFFRIMKKTSLY